MDLLLYSSDLTIKLSFILYYLQNDMRDIALLRDFSWRLKQAKCITGCFSFKRWPQMEPTVLEIFIFQLTLLFITRFLQNLNKIKFIFSIFEVLNNWGKWMIVWKSKCLLPEFSHRPIAKDIHPYPPFIYLLFIHLFICLYCTSIHRWKLMKFGHGKCIETL